MTNYKIIGFDKTTGSITVSFAENMTPLTVDVPLDEAGLYITGDALDAYIQDFIPTWHLERVSKIATGVANEAEIESLVQAPAVQQDTTDTTNPAVDANLAMWQQLETERQIAQALVKFGVLATDPTVIQTSTL